jgi:hypothetical protein
LDKKPWPDVFANKGTIAPESLRLQVVMLGLTAD